MLPNAAGTKLTGLTGGVTSNPITFNWSTSSLFLPQNDIAIVVFLQDETQRTIYQSVIQRNISDPSDVVTGIEDLNTLFNVFPNPADKEMTIELPVTPTKRTTLKMYDQMGKMVEETFFEKGDSRKTIDTNPLSGGMYLIQVESEKGVLRRKVMVVHKN